MKKSAKKGRRGGRAYAPRVQVPLTAYSEVALAAIVAGNKRARFSHAALAGHALDLGLREIVRRGAIHINVAWRKMPPRLVKVKAR